MNKNEDEKVEMNERNTEKQSRYENLYLRFRLREKERESKDERKKYILEKKKTEQQIAFGFGLSIRPD